MSKCSVKNVGTNVGDICFVFNFDCSFLSFKFSLIFKKGDLFPPFSVFQTLLSLTKALEANFGPG